VVISPIGHDHDRSGVRAAIQRGQIKWRTVARSSRKSPDRAARQPGRQNALNTVADLVREGILEQFSVEMIGASTGGGHDMPRTASCSAAPRRIGWKKRPRADCAQHGRASRVQGDRLPTVIRAVIHVGRQWRRHCAYNREESRRSWRAPVDARPPTRCVEESVLGGKLTKWMASAITTTTAHRVLDENLIRWRQHAIATRWPAQTLTDGYQRLPEASSGVAQDRRRQRRARPCSSPSIGGGGRRA